MDIRRSNMSVNHVAFSFILALAGNAPAADASAATWKAEKGGHYEIYLCAGQSNMDGRAPAKGLSGTLAHYAQPQQDVLILHSSNGLHRKLRESPGIITLRPGCSESPASFGPELSFGRALTDARKGKKLILVKVTEGGTNLYADWNPDALNQLYARLLLNVRKTQKILEGAGATSEIVGMIWMQGESDSDTQQWGKYQERLTAFIDRVRTDLKVENMPFVIGQICAANPAYQKIIAAQKAVAQNVPGTAIASSAGLKTSDKNVHFDAPSQIELGKRFATELLKLMKLHEG